MVITNTPVKIDKVVGLQIGQVGENATSQIKFDVSAWLEKYPDISISVRFKRPGEESVLACASSLEDDVLTWTVSSWETQVAGVGYAEVRAIDEDGKLAKSKVIPCSIEVCIDGTDESYIPVAIKTYVDDEIADITSDVDTRISSEESARAASDQELSEEIAVERERITNLATLDEGSTTGDAELIDIRVGADGTTYENAGTAVRSQITDLESAFDSVYTGNYSNLMSLTGPVLLGNYSIGDVVDITPLDERPATSQAHYTLLVQNVDVNERFFLHLTDGRTARPWAFLDADYKLLSVSADAYANDITIVAPAETKYLLLQCGQVHYINAVIKRYRALQSHLANGAIGLPNNKKINITDTAITFPSMTRFFYGNGSTYRLSSTTTIQRVATPDSEYSEELVIFSPSTSTLSCVGGNSFDTTQDDDILLFVLSPADNSCSLSYTMYTYNGTSLLYQKTKVNYIGLPNERKISITDTVIDIPALTRIFYGEGLTHRLSSRMIIQRVATPAGSYSEELVVFDRNALAIRCVGGSEFDTLSESDIVLFVLSKGNNGCTLPATMYTYDSESVYQKTKTGILKFVDDAKIINLLENLSNVARNDTSTAIKNRNHLLNLLYFSDIHGSTTNIRRILDFYEVYEGYIFDVIHCGDSVSVHYEDANPFATVGGDTILNVIGNHEAWKTGETWPIPYNATAAECYEKFIAPYISNWHVETAGVNLCYYYKDYVTNNIRLIILDAIHWDSAQKTWLINTLADAKTSGYAVVIASHYPPQKGITGIACTFNSIAQTIDEVIPSERQMERLPDDAYDVVDDFITGGGDFVCWLNGHTHEDFVGTVNTHSNQIAIVISCALTSNKYSDCARTNGTVTQDLFNVFSVDSNAKLIKLVRIGANYDKFFRPRNTLCINYDTKQIVSNT